MYIAGAKFEEHYLNISRVILDWVLCCFSWTTYDVITFLICIIQKHEYLQNEKRFSKKENTILLYSEKPFKQAAIIFYFMGTLSWSLKEQLIQINCMSNDTRMISENWIK